MKSEKQKLKFSKKAVIFVFSEVTIFTLIMIVIFCIKGSVPDTLIASVFAFFAAEGGCMAWIKFGETKNPDAKSISKTIEKVVDDIKDTIPFNQDEDMR